MLAWQVNILLNFRFFVEQKYLTGFLGKPNKYKAKQTFFYNLDQIVCVGACVGEIKRPARRFSDILFVIRLATGFLFVLKDQATCQNIKHDTEMYQAVI